MELLLALGAAFVFALACNLDTLLLAMGYAVRGAHMPRGGILIIALVTTAVTWLSLALGDAAAWILTPAASRVLGGLALVGIGLWFLLDCLRRLGQEEKQAIPVSRGLWDCVALSATVNFAVTLLSLPLGWALGRRLAGRWLDRLALLITGLLLVLLGLWEILL